MYYTLHRIAIYSADGIFPLNKNTETFTKRISNFTEPKSLLRYQFYLLEFFPKARETVF